MPYIANSRSTNLGCLPALIGPVRAATAPNEKSAGGRTEVFGRLIFIASVNVYRGGTFATSQIIIGLHPNLLICQDCRNVVSEVLRRTTGLIEHILPLADLLQVFGSDSPHAVHDIDFAHAYDRSPQQAFDRSCRRLS